MLQIARKLTGFTCLVCLFFSCSPEQKGKHLFILSGQSNMARLDPSESFTPTVTAEFAQENIIIVKDALGGQPIHRWYKGWKAPDGDETTGQPNLYDSLISKVHTAILNEEIASITFIWMQGERDARQKWGSVYEASLIGLYDQLSTDLKTEDMNFIIGRLSDFDLNNERYPHWTMIRDIQVRLGESNSRFAWVNTDDLNDGTDSNGKEISNDLHMSAEGYVIMGQRFAHKAIDLIQNHK